ncbi:NfeD family protein [Kamptonema cortianum]|nr:NfeD family protein [Kamptonema cortianum]MDL5044522.1 NfeD family protein [Oscillatoria amoena NRMC-F 0135]
MDTTLMIIGILTLGGFVLICAEVLLPGMIAGIFGVFLLMASVMFTGLNYGFNIAGLHALGIMIIGGIGFCFWLKYFDRLPFTSKIVLKAPQTPLDQSQTGSSTFIIGTKGRSLTPLRPAGTIEVEGRRIDAVSEGRMIEPNRVVEIISISGNVITVREPMSPDTTTLNQTNPTT